MLKQYSEKITKRKYLLATSETYFKMSDTNELLYVGSDGLFFHTSQDSRSIVRDDRFRDLKSNIVQNGFDNIGWPSSLFKIFDNLNVFYMKDTHVLQQQMHIKIVD